YLIVVGSFVSASAFAGESGHSHMSAGNTTDDRTELKLPAPLKVKQKAMMRKHLGTVGELTGLVAEGDLKGAGKMARQRLGWTPVEAEQCSKVSKMSGEDDFMTFGMALHKQADAFADAAEKGDASAALSELSLLIVKCNACHERFRH
ncbi:MAG: cytochrome c, partial [Proteobacteria bacterium]|nr:cytochrome c [Pseudomonadota bacterium]